MMSLKIALIADTHFAQADAQHPSRRLAIADVLFLRAVQRVNRFLKPDIVLILGDLVDQGGAPGVGDSLEAMGAISAKLDAPTIVIPGNHDPDAKLFYATFDRPPAFVDVKGVRFVPMVDLDEPGHNARRPTENLERMAEARAGFDGPIVCLQHVPLFPPGASDCPYNYTNAAEVIAAMRANGIGFAISGHYHEGMDLVRAEGIECLAGPALCEEPFPFLEVTLDDEGLHVTRHELRMPEALRLTDTHVHTEFAYCGENVTIAEDLVLAEEFGLAGLCFTEHTGQLYFDKDTFWRAAFMDRGVRGAQAKDRRMDDYFAALEKTVTVPSRSGARSLGTVAVFSGLEVDCDFNGRPVLLDADRARVRFLNGSMHWIPELCRPKPDLGTAADEFLGILGSFVGSGIDTLAHPFRVFHRAHVPPPRQVFEPTVRLLREHGVAAEINFHCQETEPEFVRLCLDAGVKFTLGSDSHNLYEVGELWPHLNLLETCGFNGDLEDILLEP